MVRSSGERSPVWEVAFCEAERGSAAGDEGEVSVGLFSREHQDEPENAAAGGPDGAFVVVDVAGNRLRYTPADFDEIFTTADEREMRRHVGIGWLLLDEWVGRDPGRTASWVHGGLRRAAGRVLPAEDDPEYEVPSDVATYVLGYLKDGAVGTPVD